MGKAVRIPLEEDRRVFTPLARRSLKWERCYDKRTAVERANSRLDTSFGVEKHPVRGLTKMDTRCCLALVVMLAMAVGRIKANQAEKNAKPSTGRLSDATQSAKRRRPWGVVRRAAHGSAITENGADPGSLKALRRRIRLLPAHPIGRAWVVAGIGGTAIRRKGP